MTTEIAPRILREKEVLKLLGVSRTTLGRRVRDGAFPAPFRLGPRGTYVKGWRVEEIDQWLANLKEA